MDVWMFLVLAAAGVVVIALRERWTPAASVVLRGALHGDPAPRPAKLAFWVTIAIVLGTTFAIVVSPFGTLFVGGPVIVVSCLVAACAGAVGLVVSIRRRSRAGLWMSLSPYVVVLTVVLVSRLA